jgi:WD40 repeat protein
LADLGSSSNNRFHYRFFSFSVLTITFSPNQAEPQDIKVPGQNAAPSSCNDGISSLSLSQNNLLLSSSWDNQLRCWQVGKQGALTATFAASAQHDGPVLNACFNADGSAAISGGADNTVRIWQFGASAGATVVGRHDQPVKSVHWVPNLNMIVSGSWDNTVCSAVQHIHNSFVKKAIVSNNRALTLWSGPFLGHAESKGDI